jgi:hypothetical protein
MKNSLLLFFVLLASLNFAQQNESKVKILDALKNNEIDVSITGSYVPNRYNNDLDKSGVHYGKCMDLLIANKSNSFKEIDLNVGTSLIPEDTSFQIMYVTKSVKIPLKPNAISNSNIYAMCGEISKYPPLYGVKYSVGEISSDSTIILTLKHIEKELLQNMVGQHLLWSITDDATNEQLIKYGADSNSLSKVNEARSTIFPSVNKLESAELKPAYMKVNKIRFYALVTYTIVVSGFMVYAIARTTINKEVST